MNSSTYRNLIAFDLISKFQIKSVDGLPLLLSGHLNINEQDFGSREELVAFYSAFSGLFHNSKPQFSFIKKFVAKFRVQKGDLHGLSFTFSASAAFNFLTALLIFYPPILAKLGLELKLNVSNNGVATVLIPDLKLHPFLEGNAVTFLSRFIPGTFVIKFSNISSAKRLLILMSAFTPLQLNVQRE